MKTKENKWRELKRLAKKNGRGITINKDGIIITDDLYDGCDAHFSKTVEEAIMWERGYL